MEHIETSFDKFFGLPRGQFTEFDVDSLLRTDFQTRIDGYTRAIQQGLMTPNEARAKMGGLPSVDNGDVVYAQAQMQPLGYEPPEPEPVAEPVEALPEAEAEEGAEAEQDEAEKNVVVYLKGLING